MTFWQENYGFVKEVYDYRLTKYQEWMDNLEAIVSKVMAPNVQYTYKEFKIIQDSLSSLCRDLDKEGMKDWLDMMLEKVALRAADEEGGTSTRDKELKNAEKKKLQVLIERHNKLLPSTIETQAKVEMYAKCYSYGDDIKPLTKVLDEMLWMSTKDIHPHNMNMVEEQIEKIEKVIETVKAQKELYEEHLKRGNKLVKCNNVAPFLHALLEKLQRTWKEANEKSKARHEFLTNVAKDWEAYDQLRDDINEPVEKLEVDFKKYRKFFDPEMFAKKLEQKKALWEKTKKTTDTILETVKKCYNTIVVLAGEEKKDFLDKEVSEVEEKMQIVTKAEAKLAQLSEYCQKLTEAVEQCRTLKTWAGPADMQLKQICSSQTLTPEDRVKEILILQDQANERRPQLEPLNENFKSLITDEDMEKSETAKNTLQEWIEAKEIVQATIDEIEREATSISQDDRLYADYYCLVKEFTPWMDGVEVTIKEPLPKPASLEETLALLEKSKEFDTNCVESRVKLDDAAKARSNMEKPSNTENMCESLTPRWEAVKKVSEERVAKVTSLVETWTKLQDTSVDLGAKMSEVHKLEDPKLEDLEGIFNAMKELFAKKKELVAEV